MVLTGAEELLMTYRPSAPTAGVGTRKTCKSEQGHGSQAASRQGRASFSQQRGRDMKDKLRPRPVGDPMVNPLLDRQISISRGSKWEAS